MSDEMNYEHIGMISTMPIPSQPGEEVQLLPGGNYFTQLPGRISPELLQAVIQALKQHLWNDVTFTEPKRLFLDCTTGDLYTGDAPMTWVASISQSAVAMCEGEPMLTLE